MKTLWIVCTLLATTSPAWGGLAGLNLGWSDCPDGGLSASNRTFACNTNSGSFTLVGSFHTEYDVGAVNGMEATLCLQTNTASLPSWWALAPGMCREGSLTVSFDFTQGLFNCYDYWQGGASGAISMQPLGGSRARLTVEAALPPGSPLITPIPDQVEVYAFKVVIDAEKSTGLGACAGCHDGAGLTFSGLTIHRPAGGDLFTNVPAVRNDVTWQNGIGNLLCDATPVENRTWGSIKTLYR